MTTVSPDSSHAQPALLAAAITPDLAADLVGRVSREDFPRFEAQLRSSGHCHRPVRLKGYVESCDARGARPVR